LASAAHVQPNARDGLHGVGDEGEELDALALVVHPSAVGLQGEVQAEALAGHPDLPRGALGIHHHLLPCSGRHRHHVSRTVGVEDVRVHLVQCPHERLEGRGHQLVVARLVHGALSLDAQVGGYWLPGRREEEQLRADAGEAALEANDGARGDGARESLHTQEVGGHGRHGGVVAHQDEVSVRVVGQHTIEAPDGHVRKQALVRPQRDVQALGQGENLRRLHRAYERTRENERHPLHAGLQPREVGVGLLSRLRGERPRRVVQSLRDVRIRVGVPHEENLQTCLQPDCPPLPTLVHERAAHGQRLAPALTACVVLFLWSVGCRANQGVAAAGDSGPAILAAPLADAGPYRLTPAKLEGFLTYKRLVLEGGEPSAAQLRELLRAMDAGEPESVDRAWDFLHAQGAREAAARSRSGLNSAEVRVIESMAADVAAARVFARPMGLGKLSEDLAAARSSLPPERQAAVDATLAALREDEARVERLADEREAWGDANVDLLLTREKELVRLYEVQVRGARDRLSVRDAGR
jgi:hypothetical protein